MDFVQKKFNVKFPMLSKLDVNGSSTHELYRFLKSSQIFKKENGAEDIPWNFAKFLVNKDGQVVNYYGPKVNPSELKQRIEELLE